MVLLRISSMSLFTVDQREKAMIFRLGEITSIKTEPGLFWKLPLVENVRFFVEIVKRNRENITRET